jgi:hypothetical protein
LFHETDRPRPAASKCPLDGASLHARRADVTANDDTGMVEPGGSGTAQHLGDRRVREVDVDELAVAHRVDEEHPPGGGGTEPRRVVAEGDEPAAVGIDGRERRLLDDDRAVGACDAGDRGAEVEGEVRGSPTPVLDTPVLDGGACPRRPGPARVRLAVAADGTYAQDLPALSVGVPPGGERSGRTSGLG